jgi:hypothetical protein
VRIQRENDNNKQRVEAILALEDNPVNKITSISKTEA